MLRRCPPRMVTRRVQSSPERVLRESTAKSGRPEVDLGKTGKPAGNPASSVELLRRAAGPVGRLSRVERDSVDLLQPLWRALVVFRLITWVFACFGVWSR